MKTQQYYTAYRARTMCPICSDETEIFITNKGVFPTPSNTCHNCSHNFSADQFIVSFLEKTGNSTVSSLSSL